MVGRPVRDLSGRAVGTLADVVVRDDPGHPEVVRFVVRIGPRRAWLHTHDTAGLDQGQLTITSTRFDLTDVDRRDGEIQLMGDVIDHQLLDLNGVRVVRASDLYLAKPTGRWQLVAVDVSWRSLVRRALPGQPGRRPSPSQVLDWAAIRPFLGQGHLSLAADTSAIRRLRPSDLADLLEDLGRIERRELLAHLDQDTAADALEEMESTQLTGLLLDASTEHAAQLVATMERDEATEALRELPDGDRERILGAMPKGDSGQLRTLLSFDEDTAGGVMTSDVVTIRNDQSVGEAIAALQAAHGSPPGIAVVDADGSLVDDVTVLELLGVDPATPIAHLVGPPWPTTVSPGAELEEIVDVLIENRGTALIVVDDQNRPIGQIMADDVIDALISETRKAWPWQRP